MSSKLDQLLASLSTAQQLASELQSELASNIPQSLQAAAAAESIKRAVQPAPFRAFDILFSTFRLPAVRTALDAGWLEAITQADPQTGITAAELASRSKSSPALVIRLMRFLAATAVVEEVGTNTYAPNPLTHFLLIPGWSAGVRHFSSAYPGATAKMPQYLANLKYQDPPGAPHDLFTYANGAPFFTHVSERPKDLDAFDSFMVVARTSLGPTWLDVYPLEKLKVESSDDVLLIDVGGGRGHDLHAFAEKRKSLGLEGKLVLEDRPDVVVNSSAEWREDFGVREHDFFQPQPEECVGAKAYFLKMIMHDWPDSSCIQILSHLRDAMKPGYSRILINDNVLLDRNCSVVSAASDMAMLTVLSGKERTKAEWQELIGKVDGLEIEDFYVMEEGGRGVVEIVRKQ
ncbi:hypothetical protein BAUCODRAFT_565242 [Baudoinia panamericana UAMH 10762]|uniref:O-methyltransferase C-terminal domain-containing protein n=1 Tax=Baudoinia panamericana (strain UAMH 10762) TaxID=717646 RepID=M2ME60_BAUPA|nr:uncharacterized protein BAUCODRAFT_565242 [Baudoinia panamericana UAMH 10762]EMC94871.1 hypothetical protein BAUCODRAFT_565242 [Baudoinia panamericana UAMH 10762]